MLTLPCGMHAGAQAHSKASCRAFLDFKHLFCIDRVAVQLNAAGKRGSETYRVFGLDQEYLAWHSPIEGALISHKHTRYLIVPKFISKQLRTAPRETWLGASGPARLWCCWPSCAQVGKDSNHCCAPLWDLVGLSAVCPAPVLMKPVQKNRKAKPATMQAGCPAPIHSLHKHLFAAGASAQKATCDENSCMADLKAVVPQGYDGDSYGYYGSGGSMPPLREFHQPPAVLLAVGATTAQKQTAEQVAAGGVVMCQRQTQQLTLPGAVLLSLVLRSPSCLPQLP